MSTTDSGYAWIIPFVCFFIQATLFGTYRVYGLLYTVVIDTFQVSRSTAAWPFSLCMTFVHLTGPVSGLLNQYFSSRSISFVGCFFAALGVGLCYTATNVFQIIIYIGIIQGFGIGLTYVQNNAITNQYFIKYRATANGISLSGGTIGSFALSYLIEICLKMYTLQEIFLILSAIILSTLPICLLMKPFRGISQTFLKEIQSEEKNVSPKILNVNDLNIREYSEKFPEYSNEAFCSNENSGKRKMSMSEIADLNAIEKAAQYQRRLSVLTPTELIAVSREERKRIKKNNEQVMNVATVYLKSYKNIHSDGITFTGSNAIMVPMNSALSNNSGFIRRSSLASTFGKTIANVTKKFERRVSSGCNNLNQNSNLRRHTIESNRKLSSKLSICNEEIPEKICNTETMPYNHDRRISRAYTVSSRTGVIDTFDSDSNISNGSIENESTMKLMYSILKNQMFILICLTHMAYFWSSITYTMIIVDFSLDKGISISQSVNLLNSFAAGDLIGRLGSGWFMDNSILPLHSLALFTTTGIGILLSVTTLANNYYFFLSISAILGLLSGTINILLNVLFCKYVGSSKAALAFGLSAFFCGLFTLGRPLVVGHFRDQINGSYDGLFMTLGLVTIAIGSLWLFESCISKCNENDSDSETEKTVSEEIIYVEKV